MSIQPYLKTIFACLFIGLSCSFCSKKDKTKPKPVEKDLAVTIDGVIVDSDMNATQGTTHNITINITSEMPPGGVTIEVTAMETPQNTMIPQDGPITTSEKSTSFTLKDLTSLKLVQVTVKVTSVSKPGNTVTLQFGTWNKVQ